MKCEKSERWEAWEDGDVAMATCLTRKSWAARDEAFELRKYLNVFTAARKKKAH